MYNRYSNFGQNNYKSPAPILSKDQRYKRMRLLKEGGFGKAYLCLDLSDHSKCVIKETKTSSMKQNEINEILKEANILKALKHPNIISFRDVYTNSKKRICIAMDYADGGDLHGLLSKSTTYFREEQILDWFTQICLAIKHIHDRKIVHRDLKSMNIFITKMGIIKLGDFGISKILSHTNEFLSTFVGTWHYMSPEIINSQPYNFKTDIWSLGVLLYEMCTGKLPFRGSNDFVIRRKIKAGVYSSIPVRYSQGIKDLVADLIQLDSKKRPSIHQILAKTIVKSRISQFLSEGLINEEFSHTVLHNQNVLRARFKEEKKDNRGLSARKYESSPMIGISKLIHGDERNRDKAIREFDKQNYLLKMDKNQDYKLNRNERSKTPKSRINNKQRFFGNQQKEKKYDFGFQRRNSSGMLRSGSNSRRNSKDSNNQQNKDKSPFRLKRKQNFPQGNGLNLADNIIKENNMMAEKLPPKNPNIWENRKRDALPEIDHQRMKHHQIHDNLPIQNYHEKYLKKVGQINNIDDVFNHDSPFDIEQNKRANNIHENLASEIKQVIENHKLQQNLYYKEDLGLDGNNQRGMDMHMRIQQVHQNIKKLDKELGIKGNRERNDNARNVARPNPLKKFERKYSSSGFDDLMVARNKRKGIFFLYHLLTYSSR